MPTNVMNKVVFEDVREKVGNRGLVKTSCHEKAYCSNESSSSIGKNSDLSEDLSEKLGDDDEEVESKYKGPLDAMDALEQVLPIRRGISRFYDGKSKSFASLAEISSSSSIKEIVKPNNAYTRKRTNMVARNLTPLRANGNSVGISKRMMTSGSGRSAALALAVALNNSERDHNNKMQTVVISSHVKDFCSLRSFSLADLQQHCFSVNLKPSLMD
ncbi:hypothetical protein CASFOL_000198 [Castilleja foliolosa]|uniref:Uncharacterized protein n=1 Tax=Castilleja foliolosa TaxID=1961234 RepID=A0ABD3EMZ6_9LAMI